MHFPALNLPILLLPLALLPTLLTAQFVITTTTTTSTTAPTTSLISALSTTSTTGLSKTITTTTSAPKSTTSNTASPSPTTSYNPDAWKGEGLPTERCLKDWCADVQGLIDACNKVGNGNETRMLECYCDKGNGRGTITLCITRCYSKATKEERKKVIDPYNKKCPAYQYGFPGDDPVSTVYPTVYGYERTQGAGGKSAAAGRLVESVGAGYGIVVMVAVIICGMAANGV
ncbi:hypothetical protein DFH27DRAFT_614277 [Peziza echinospora]|nr:hypothetical protein DFH27DRAFT_614277 [Peziza echinospora]